MVPSTPLKRKLSSSNAETPEPKTVTTKGSFGCAFDPSVEVHTLILGTQPSDVSLGANRYYDTHTNALWHIVGDSLGWRRGWLDGKGRGPPPSIQRSLLHERTLTSYDDALADLTSRGYALWDVLRESERAGSLDGDIKNAQPADVRGLVAQHPKIRRICLASGASTATFFKRHFKSWLAEAGAFHVHPGRLSQQAFGKVVPPSDAPQIELVVMESVSPAFVPSVSYGDKAIDRRTAGYAEAGYQHLSRRASAYAWKRQQWFECCFARELSDGERRKRFGDRPGDFVDSGGRDARDVD